MRDFWEILENLKIFKFRNIHWKVSFPGFKSNQIRIFLAQTYRHGIDEGPQISLDTHNTLIRRIEASKYDFKEKVKNHPYVALLIHIRAMWLHIFKNNDFHNW